MTATTLTLADFILARVAEDEAVAREASPGGWDFGGIESIAGGMLYDETRTIASVVYEQREDHDGSIVRHMLAGEANANGRHIARYDPARVLAECEARREVIATCLRWDGDRVTRESPPASSAFEHVLRSLAKPYADHPDFREEWA